jgi:endonuclease/exonuclease/phosphatase family metal-dependent hydrolase
MRVRVRLVFLSLLLAGCASTAPPLRVMVYNIHAGKDAAGVDNLERVAALIRSTNSDVVLLQEVDRGTARSGNVDQLGVLMRLTGMHGVFGKSLDYQGGHYGIAILSRWPLTAERVIPLRIDPPQPRAGGSLEPRVALFAETGGLRIVNTHLDASREDTWRLQEAARLLESIEGAHLIGGDFNSLPDSAVQRYVRSVGLRDAFAECGTGEGLTYPAHEPVKRIDYLFLRGNGRCTAASVFETAASDHRPLLVRVEQIRQGLSPNSRGNLRLHRED